MGQVVTAEDIASFYQRREHCVVTTASCWWYDPYHNKRVYSPVPANRLLSPSPQEVEQFFRSCSGAYAIRFLSPCSSEKGKPSCILTRRAPYGLECLSGNVRSKIRRGSRWCQIRQLDFVELTRSAERALYDTMQRHGQVPTGLGIDEGLQDCAAFQAWGAFVEGTLASYIVTLQVDDCAEIIIGRSVSALLKYYPNNALVFAVTHDLLARPGVSMVSYGLESLVSHESLDQFKLSMGFQREQVRQRVVFRPWLRALLAPKICETIALLARLRPNDHRFARLAGFLEIAAIS